MLSNFKHLTVKFGPNRPPAPPLLSILRQISILSPYSTTLRHQPVTSSKHQNFTAFQNKQDRLVRPNPYPRGRSIFIGEFKMADARYCVEYAKTGRSACKKCKQQIEKGAGRIGKITANYFSDDGGEMKAWYHMRCMFETLKRARATTKKIETAADLEGFPEMKDEEKTEIKSLIKEFVDSKASSAKTSAAGKKKKAGGASSETKATAGPSTSKPSSNSTTPTKTPATPTKMPATPATTVDETDAPAGGSTNPDNSFYQFCKLCRSLEKEPSYNAKTKLISNFIKFGSSGGGYQGDVYLLVKLLLPTAGKKRVYNLQSKQIVKLLSQVFGCSVDDMVEDLEQGDVAETARSFFETSVVSPPAKTSTITLADVDTFLDNMTLLTKEEEQKVELARITKRCTAADLKMIIRLIKHDLRINAGAKHVLDALDPNAYAAFQASNDLRDVVDRVMNGGGADDGGVVKPGMKKKLSVRANIMTPVKPMLAEACRSVAMAMKKCPHGMYAEIKYDGERVQVHKQGEKFEYFSRSLKTVQPHKVEHIKSYLAKACPHGNSMILDCEVLMVDTKTSKPLPFGTLGIHKKTAFKDASCCLFIFDIIYFNGETLMDKPIRDRRKLLEQNISQINNRIMLSEQTLIKHEDDRGLSDLIMSIIRQGLEGLVLKDVQSIYEPGKRHWLKVKKDYLEGGAMADTADLIVLGAYYGTGNKGGMMSVFLMGVYDKSCDKFRTVAKCGNGHDDATLAKLQKELDMVKISKDMGKVPSWLLVNKTVIPDLVVRDPKAAPVWEITGAEFSSSNIHTAAGISIRFPRVTRIRDDKDWTNATDLDRLKVLFKTSKENVDIPGLAAVKGEGATGGSSKEEKDDEAEEEEMETDAISTPKASPSTSQRKRKLGATPTKATPTKGAEPGPSPRKRVKQECKYGAKCYQKSKEHKEQFHHPWDTLDSPEVKCAGVPIKNPLRDIFSGVKIYLLPGTQEVEKLRRYFITYAGEVVEEFQKSSATYFITDNGKPSECADPTAKCLKAKWVWDSIQQKQQLPIEDYLV